MTEHVTAIGVDGCPVGWIAAHAHENELGQLVRTELRLVGAESGGLTALVDDCEARWPPPVVAIDVPMGLPRCAGLRECDREARCRLGRRWMCVFPAPDRELLGRTFEEAREHVRARRFADPVGHHPILSRQAIAIMPKIAEVDVLLRERPARQRWLIEVHPELSFLALAQALNRPEAQIGLPRKQRSAGKTLRRALLAAVTPDIDGQLAEVSWPRTQVGVDDVLDAYAALWSARRYRTPAREILGDGLPDDHGLARQMIV
jgi:predicted RNase H-like nuclease